MPRTFCINCGKQMSPEEVEGTTKEGYCYDCAASEVAVGEDSVPLPPVSESGPSGPEPRTPRGATDAGYEVDELEDEDEDEPPSWLPDPLSSAERSWIRDRPGNVPPAGFVVGALIVIAWLWLILGLVGSVVAGIAVADCEETLFRECDNATTEGYLAFGIGAASSIFGAFLLWGFAHLIDLSLESRERLEDLFAGQSREAARPKRGRSRS